MLEKIKIIFWDFDGVLIDSNHVRERGFEKVLVDFPDEQVKQLLEFHQANGGLSRYVKFRYFFESILGKTLSEKELLFWTEQFSLIMRKHLVAPSLLIKETIDFVKKNHSTIVMHIVSGSDQEELRYLCEMLDIACYFKTINGSPCPKVELVKQILDKYRYCPLECVLVGDSINDYQAALANNIKFMAYNNSNIEKYSDLRLVFNID